MRKLLPILLTSMSLSSCGDLPINEEDSSEENEENASLTGSCLFESVNPSSIPSASFSLCLEFSEISSSESQLAQSKCSEGSEDLDGAKGSWRETSCERESATAQCQLDEFEGSSNQAYLYDADFNFVLSSSQGEGLCAENSFKELVAPNYKSARVQFSQGGETLVCFQLDQLTEFSYEQFQSEFSGLGLELEQDQTCETSTAIASCIQDANSLGVEVKQYYYSEVYDQDDIDECISEGGSWQTSN